MTGYFVTGTDTNVGKTYVTCMLARLAVSLGHKVFAFKPIESGCALGSDGGYIGSDQTLLVAAAGSWQAGPLRGLYQLPLPAAPLVAAASAGTFIDVDLVVSSSQLGPRSGASLTLIEGAGGWRVPITASVDMAALAARLSFPVIVVARATLGTINHTLLTVEAIERDGLHIAAVVMSKHPDDDDLAAASNRTEVARRWPGQVILLRSPDDLLPLVPPAPPL